MIIQILLTIVFYFILLYISVNLLGLFVRGLFPKAELDRVKKEAPIFIKISGNDQEYLREQRRTTIIALLLNIAFFYLLFSFWNFGVVLASILIMMGRLPDLLWDIKHGKKTDPKLMDKNVSYYISTLLSLLAIPVLYYSLYIFK